VTLQKYYLVVLGVLLREYGVSFLFKIYYLVLGALCVLLLASQTSAFGQLVLLAFDVGMRAMFILVAESLFFAEIPCIKWYKILRDPNSEQQIRQPKENSELIQVLVSKNHWIIIDEKTLKVSNFDRRVYLDHPKFKPGWKVISVGNKTISDVKEFYTSLNLEREKEKTKDVRFTLEKPTILGDGFTSEYRFSVILYHKFCNLYFSLFLCTHTRARTHTHTYAHYVLKMHTYCPYYKANHRASFKRF